MLRRNVVRGRHRRSRGGDVAVMRVIAETMSTRPISKMQAIDKPQSKWKAATSSTDTDPSTSQSCLKQDWRPIMPTLRHGPSITR